MLHSYVIHDQRVNPIKSHETTMFLWFSYGLPEGCRKVEKNKDVEIKSADFIGVRAPILLSQKGFLEVHMYIMSIC